MKILVTGASGFIGKNLIYYLSKTNNKIFAQYNTQKPQFKPKNIEYIKFNLLNKSYKVLEEYIDILDYIMIMSVSPGFGGQGFIEETLTKMEKTNLLCKNNNRRDEILIGVDGGVNLKTIDKVYATGIDITVVGSGLYKAPDIISRFKELENR